MIYKETYKGVNIYRAMRNSSGIRYTTSYGHKADTLAGTKRLISERIDNL